MIEADYILSEKFSDINQLDKIILPGVGNMKNINKAYINKMKLEINQFIANGGTIFGICLGLQILFDHSMESDTDTLGLLNGQVVPVEQD